MRKTGIFLAADGRRRRTESDAERMPDRCAHWRRYCVGQRKMETGVSTGIGYEGEALQPCTKYEVKAEVWDNHGGKAEAESSFETGLMDSLYAAWEGAEWIGAPHATVCAENRGVLRSRVNFGWKAGREKRVSSLEPMTSV